MLRWMPALACVAAVVVCCGGAAQARQRPNLLFIYADDHSAKTVSCYERAYPMARTPNIDALAAAGVRFQGAYLGSWCMPSRASLLTGHHPHAIRSMRMAGQYPGSVYDPAQCPFWPAVFRRYGYQTAQIGKWHTGTDAGWGRDWDFQIVWNRPKHPENAGSYYGRQIMDFNGQERVVDGYSTDNYTDWAVSYIRGENRDPGKPWYLWLCYGAIHGPTTPAARHKGACAGQQAEPPADIFGPRPGKPQYLERTQAWKPGPDGEPVFKNGAKTHSQWLQQVNECMLAVDEGVGRLLAALKESGQLHNTLVVYTSDQGFANGEHGMRQKVAPYDATYRSPLIVSMPGTIPEGKYCPQPVNAPDLVVTFFAQAGIQQPWKMHGRDITPLLLNPERAEWDHPTLFEHTGQDYGSDVTKALAGRLTAGPTGRAAPDHGSDVAKALSGRLTAGPTGRAAPDHGSDGAKALSGGKEAVHSGVPYYVAVRHGRYKYVRYLGADEPEELYDLQSDPEELTNLAASAEHREVRDRMYRLLREELRRCDADFVSRLERPAAAKAAAKD